MTQFVNGNLLNLLGLLLGLIGVALAFFFYYRSIREPIPAYVYAWRTRIVDKSTSATPGLQVLHDGVPLKGQDITSATFYVWNAGRGPIRAADVLTEFAFVLGEDGMLLHANVLKATRPECEVSISLAQPMSNTVKLNFGILEYRDGVAVQLIFSGSPDTPVALVGACIGAEKIRDASIEYRGNHFNYENWIRTTFLSTIIFLMGGAMFVSALMTRQLGPILLAIIFFLPLSALGLYGVVAGIRIKAGSYNSSLKRLIDTKS